MAPVTVLSAARYYEPSPWKFAFHLRLSCGHSLDLRFRHAYQLPYKVRTQRGAKRRYLTDKVMCDRWTDVGIACPVC